MNCVVVPPKTDARPEPPAFSPPVKVDAPVRARTSTPSTLVRSVSTTEPSVVIEIVSLPMPPTTVAASANSGASAKTIMSAPLPAMMVSTPPLPMIESFPLPPEMESAFELPKIVSAPRPPTMVHPLPVAAEFAVPSIQDGRVIVNMEFGFPA